jgi:hypothetical protein
MGSKSKSRFPAGSLDFRGLGILAFFQTARMEDIRNFLSLGLSCTRLNGASTMYGLIHRAEEWQRIRSSAHSDRHRTEEAPHPVASRFGTGLATGAVFGHGFTCPFDELRSQGGIERATRTIPLHVSGLRLRLRPEGSTACAAFPESIPARF